MLVGGAGSYHLSRFSPLDSTAVSPCKPRPHVSSYCPTQDCHSDLDQDMQPSNCRCSHSQNFINSHA